jgi:hypothetical protein
MKAPLYTHMIKGILNLLTENWKCHETLQLKKKKKVLSETFLYLIPFQKIKLLLLTAIAQSFGSLQGCVTMRLNYKKNNVRKIFKL